MLDCILIACSPSNYSQLHEGYCLSYRAVYVLFPCLLFSLFYAERTMLLTITFLQYL